MTEFNCKDNGGIVKLSIIQFSDLKKLTDGGLELKRKYGKFKRPIINIDFREPEIIGLA
jgi:hypothetical protein